MLNTKFMISFKLRCKLGHKLSESRISLVMKISAVDVSSARVRFVSNGEFS